MSDRLPTTCVFRCTLYSLIALAGVLAAVAIGAWLAGAALPPWSLSTLLAVAAFLVSVAAAAMLACAAFCFIEKLTGPLLL